MAYGGVGKPPHCEVIFKADDNSTPPDVTVTISFPNRIFTISRVAEASSEGQLHTLDDNTNRISVVVEKIHRKSVSVVYKIEQKANEEHLQKSQRFYFKT